MMRRGDVRAVRELSAGVQATVCLGSDVEHGYATITTTCKSPEVVAALQSLKEAIRAETVRYIQLVDVGQREWDQEMGR